MRDPGAVDACVAGGAAGGFEQLASRPSKSERPAVMTHGRREPTAATFSAAAGSGTTGGAPISTGSGDGQGANEGTIARICFSTSFAFPACAAFVSLASAGCR